MKVKRIVEPLIALASLLAVSRLMRGREVSMHEMDWEQYDGMTPRRYRSAGHVAHHALDLMAMNLPLAGIYLGRSISPAFREQVMIVTATANSCPP
jgi:hypothetical protein